MGGGGVEAALPRDRSVGRHHCSFVEFSLHSAGPAQEAAKSEISINLANTIHQPHPIWHKALPGTFPHKQPALAHTVDFPQISQSSTNPKQAASSLGMLYTSC